MILFSLLAALAVQKAQGVNAAEALRAVRNAPDEAWETLAPENLLVMELPSGTLLIEMRPDLAPGHVERVRELARDGFYDGLTFHRVIEGFMAQGGDPVGDGTGGSDLPDIAGEFAQPISEAREAALIGRDDRAAQVGFLGAVPVGTQAPTLGEFLDGPKPNLWGLHCPGVMSMARAGDPNSANSQFFLMLGDSRDNLDQRYTVWGRVVDGQRETRRINRGEPPARPTPIVRLRLASEIPQDERPSVEILNPHSETLRVYLQGVGVMSETGYVEDMCNARVPARVNGEIRL